MYYEPNKLNQKNSRQAPNRGGESRTLYQSVGRRGGECFDPGGRSGVDGIWLIHFVEADREVGT